MCVRSKTVDVNTAVCCCRCEARHVCPVLISTSPMCRQSHHTMLHLLLLLSCLATCSCWPQCVQESSLTLSAVHFVSEQHLEERTVAGCIVHCLTRPGVESVMVSYSPGVLGILGDQLNCLCGQQGALDQAVLEEAAMCAVTCPGGDLSCGRFIAVFGNHFTTAKTETGIPRSASFVFIAFATTIAVGCFARVTTAPYRCH